MVVILFFDLQFAEEQNSMSKKEDDKGNFGRSGA